MFSYFCVFMTKESTLMHRCIELAKKGLGTTFPNPMVGALLVYNNKIVSEGWHQKPGEKHAEILAIENLQDKSILKKCVLYVNLEPCNHFGKTPPCSQSIVEAKILKVVIGTKDPFEKVNGSGIAFLKNKGVEVVENILEKKCQLLNKRFFTFHLKKRPYIILKWAESKDGFLAPLYEKRIKGKPFLLSNNLSRQKVHQWRSEEQTILVGCQTIIDDNPSLTTRLWKGKNPIRIIIDPKNRIPKNAKVFDQKEKTIIFTTVKNVVSKKNIVYKCIPFNNPVDEILEALHNEKIQSILIEGGKITLEHFIKKDLWDEMRIFKTPITLEKGIKAPNINIKNATISNLENDRLFQFFNTSFFNLSEIL